jgi:hypothetical protein
MVGSKLKKNIDYSASAVNLCNPTQVEVALGKYTYLQQRIDELKAQLEAYPEQQEIDELSKQQEEIRRGIIAGIDTYGSYQDLLGGHYAVKQRAVTVSYSPEKCHEVLHSSLVAAVIVESVDKGTVEALAKAGRITDTQLEAISKKSESYRFIIR